MNIIRLSIDDPDQEGGNFTVQLSDSAGTFGLSRRDENTFFITLSGTLDRETTPVYNISVTAWDNGTPPLSVSVLCPQGKKCQMLSSHQNEVKFYQLNHLYFSTFTDLLTFLLAMVQCAWEICTYWTPTACCHRCCQTSCNLWCCFWIHPTTVVENPEIKLKPRHPYIPVTL